jgi:hypothetical protein
MVYGKDCPYGTKSKRRIILQSPRITRSLLSRPNAHGPIVKVAPGVGLATTATGLRQLVQALAADGPRLNHKRVPRIYCNLKLNKRRKGQDRFAEMSFTAGGT